MRNPYDAEAVANPFPGLRPFRGDEEHLYFGREQQVDAMIDKLAGPRFLAVVGSSGSGKSSLVNCGLRPTLHRGLMSIAGTAWRMVQFRPGGQPLRSLARALANDAGLFAQLGSDAISVDVIDATLRLSKLGLVDLFEQSAIAEGTNLLVVVDQFEELFRYANAARPSAEVAQSRAATAFVNLLLAASEQRALPIYVVLTMRSDFLGDCAQFAGLPEAINRGEYLVPRLTRDERRAAIVGPVRVGGARIDPLLATRLLNDVGDNPDQLSILQHALNRTWAAWQADGEPAAGLSLSHYEAIGTMAHALDRHADEAYAELADERERTVCERLFKAITDRGSDSRGIRRPNRVAALCAVIGASPAEVWAVVETFRIPSRSFLMPPPPEPLESDTVIDISHESLMRVWKRLARWAADEAQSAQRYRRLAETAIAHAAGQAALLRDPELQLALDWNGVTDPNPAWAEQYGGRFETVRSFLADSERERDAELRSAQARQQHELAQARALADERARSARRLRVGFACAAVLAVAALGAAGWAFDQRMAAKRLGEIALSRQLASQALLLGAEPSTDIEPAALLAIEAMRLFPSLDSDRALRDAGRRLTRETGVVRHQGAVRCLDYSPDSRTVVTCDSESVRMLDAGASRIRWRDDFPGGANAAVFSPDGSRIGVAGGDGFARLLDAASGKELWRVKHDGAVNAVAFAADGSSLVTGANDKTMRVLDLRSGDEVRRVTHDDAVKGVASAGHWIVTASGTRTRLLDMPSAEDAWDLRQQQGLSPMSMSTEGTVHSAVLSNDASRLLVHRSFEWGNTGWAVFDVPAGKILLTGKGGGGAAFSRDSKFVASDSTDGVEVREVTTGMLISKAAGRGASAIAFSPDGGQVAAGSAVVSVLDAASGAELVRSAPHPGITAVRFARDGFQVASAGSDGGVRFQDTVSDTAPSLLAPLGGRKGRMVISHDGLRLLASGPGFPSFFVETLPGFTDWASVFDVGHGTPILALTAAQLSESLLGGGVAAVELGADGSRAFFVTPDGTGVNGVRTFDTASRRELWRAKGPFLALASSPDGRWLAAGAEDAVRIFDATTGARVGRIAVDRPADSLAFSADGRTLAAGSSGSTRLFDAATRAELRRLAVPGRLAALSADGSRIVTVGEGMARVIDAGSSRELSRVGFSDEAGVLRLSNDGRWLAVGSGSVAHVLDAASGKAMSRMVVAGDIGAVVFQGDGLRVVIATHSANKIVVTRHRFLPQDMIDHACARLTRNLTQAEWQTYVGNDQRRPTCPSLP